MPLYPRIIAHTPFPLWKRISYRLHANMCSATQTPFLFFTPCSRQPILFLEVPISFLSLRSRFSSGASLTSRSSFLLEDPLFCSRVPDFLLDKPLEVLFPSSRRPFPVDVLILSSESLHLQGAVSLLQRAYDFNVPFTSELSLVLF